MIRNLLLLACWVLAFGLSINTARADTFTATYRELAPSPLNVATTWYSGALPLADLPADATMGW